MLHDGVQNFDIISKRVNPFRAHLSLSDGKTYARKTRRGYSLKCPMTCPWSELLAMCRNTLEGNSSGLSGVWSVANTECVVLEQKETPHVVEERDIHLRGAIGVFKDISHMNIAQTTRNVCLLDGDGDEYQE